MSGSVVRVFFAVALLAFVAAACQQDTPPPKATSPPKDLPWQAAYEHPSYGGPVERIVRLYMGEGNVAEFRQGRDISDISCEPPRGRTVSCVAFLVRHPKDPCERPVYVRVKGGRVVFAWVPLFGCGVKPARSWGKTPAPLPSSRMVTGLERFANPS